MRFLLTLLSAFFATASPTWAAEASTPRAVTANLQQRDPAPLAVTEVGAGQAGYVHYFLIAHADGELEYQVGIELEDQRIAWSFPEIGVEVVNFARERTIHARGKPFRVKHLYGIRPFGEDAQMSALRKALPARVAQWVDDQVPYCQSHRAGTPFCLSCGDFAVRILFPGPLPQHPSLPRDMGAFGGGLSTDDLLLYLAGLHNQPDARAALRSMNIPAAMREDMLAMLQDAEAPRIADKERAVPAQDAVKPAAVAPTGRRIASRRPAARKL